MFVFGNKHNIIQVVGLDGDNKELFESFIKLKICRDAYWKIYGEQMGLGKPWKPDWNINEYKYGFQVYKKEIAFIMSIHTQIAFPMPMEEMQDAFYKNFKDLIEECKELL